MRDATFGELWVGGHRPFAFDHVFASIQSLAATDLEHLDPARHESELPMAVTWRLHHALPGDLFASFAVAVA